jgi:hypothetical protein
MNKTNLAELIDKQFEVLNQLGLTGMQEMLTAIKMRLNDSITKVLIAGEYSRGKTTLINALLGEELLPTGALPVQTTNVVDYAEKKEVFVISSGATKQVSPEALSEGEYQRIELHYPSDLCRGVQWIEHPSVSELPDDFSCLIREVDLIIVVLASDALFSAAENRWVAEIKAAGHSETFFVCNFLDRIPSTQVDQVKQAALARIPASPDKIFFISALPALKGQAEAVASFDLFHQALRKAVSKVPEHFKPARAVQLLGASLDLAQEHLGARHAERSELNEALKERKHDLYLRYEAIAAVIRDLDQDMQRLLEDVRDVVQTITGNLVRKLALELEEHILSYEGKDLDAVVDTESKKEIEAWKAKELVPYLDKLAQQQREMLTNGVSRVLEQLRHFYELTENMPGSLESTPVGEKELHTDVDLRLNGPGVYSDTSKFQPLQEPTVTITAGVSLLVMFMLRPAPFGVVAGALGLAVAATLAISKQQAARHTARELTAQRYGNALRSQIDAVSLAVWNDVRSRFEQSQTRIIDWTEACKREAQECLTRESEQAAGDGEYDNTEDIRRHMDEIRKAVSLL